MVADEIDFNRDIRPIISDNCFACHGFDKGTRKGELRLDQREAAMEDRGGYAVIVPGKPEESALIERVTSSDADLVMPPTDSHKKPPDHSSPSPPAMLRDLPGTARRAASANRCRHQKP